MLRMGRNTVHSVVDVASLGFIIAAVIFTASVATYVEYDMYLAVVNIFLITLIALSFAISFGLKFAKFDYTLVIKELQSIALIASLGFCLTAGLQFLILKAATKMAITDVWGSNAFHATARKLSSSQHIRKRSNFHALSCSGLWASKSIHSISGLYK